MFSKAFFFRVVKSQDCLVKSETLLILFLSTQVPLSKKSLNSDDVFILDAGTTVWQYNGNTANPFEKARVSLFLMNSNINPFPNDKF